MPTLSVMYLGVPKNFLESPKSMILMLADGEVLSNMMFSYFKSRCTTPFSCMYWSAETIWLRILAASRSLYGDRV